MVAQHTQGCTDQLKENQRAHCTHKKDKTKTKVALLGRQTNKKIPK